VQRFRWSNVADAVSSMYERLWATQAVIR
jgi:hypothetical protein